jgi:hypothetical protein
MITENSQKFALISCLELLAILPWPESEFSIDFEGRTKREEQVSFSKCFAGEF